MLTVSIENDFDFSSPEYADLFARSFATAFQAPLWLTTFYNQLAVNLGAVPLVVTMRDVSGRLRMLLPLVRQRRGWLNWVEFADLRVADYTAPVCSRRDCEEIAADPAVVRQLRQLLRPFDFVRVQKLRADIPAFERLLGISTRIEMDMSAHAVDLDAPFEQWRERNIDPSYLRELNKKHRQLRKKGKLEFREASEPDAILKVLEQLREFRRPRFPNDLLQQQAYFEFYRRLALGSAPRLARLYALLLDEQPIAAVLGLEQKSSFLVVLSGFDQENHRKQSVGALLFEEVARDCISRGVTSLDFTIGDESYKRLFGTRPTGMASGVGAGSFVGVLALLALRKVPFARQAARRLVGYRKGGPVMVGS